jgi:hypothetical protein
VLEDNVGDEVRGKLLGQRDEVLGAIVGSTEGTSVDKMLLGMLVG